MGLLARRVPVGYTRRLPDGAVAQLGARMTGSHEVTGSIPVSSTNKRPHPAPEIPSPWRSRHEPRPTPRNPCKSLSLAK